MVEDNGSSETPKATIAYWDKHNTHYERCDISTCGNVTDDFHQVNSNMNICSWCWTQIERYIKEEA